MWSVVKDVLGGQLQVWHVLAAIPIYWLIKGGQGFKGVKPTIEWIFYVFNWFKKRSWVRDFERKFNSVTNDLSGVIFNNRLSIKWASTYIINNYLYGSDEDVTVYVDAGNNNNEIVVNSVRQYVESIYPKIGYFKYTEFRDANISHLVGHIVSKIYRHTDIVDIGAIDEFKSNQAEGGGDESSPYREKINYLAERKYYLNIFLNAIFDVGGQSSNVLRNTAMGREMVEWFGWVYEKAKRSPGDKKDLEFERQYFKYSVILVASEDTLEDAGTHAHVKRIERELLERYSRIYVLGLRQEDIAHVRHICHEISKSGCEIIKEKRFESRTRGSLKYIAIVDNKNVKSPSAIIPEKELLTAIEDVVPSVRNGEVNVLDIARRPGVGSKVLVEARDSDKNAVGMCVGKGGEYTDRIRDMVGDEFVNFVPNATDPKERIVQTLFPLKAEHIRDITIHDSESVDVLVDKEKMGLALGKHSVNIKLARRLLGLDIRISAASSQVEMHES